MQSFSDVLQRWPDRASVAVDCGVTYGVVKQWERRDSVPAAYWPALLEGARRRNIEGLTAEVLADLAAQSRDEKATAERLVPRYGTP